MANTTYSLIQSWLPDVISATEMYLQQTTVMPNLVQVFGDLSGLQVRRADKYAAGTVGTLTDGTDITTAQTFARTPFGTITPTEVGDRFVITDARVESENAADIMQDLSEHIGATMRAHLDTNLMGNFTNLTGGTVGSAGGSLTWDIIAAAQSRLRAAGVPAPYMCVLHAYSFYDLATARDNAVPLMVEEALRGANDFYVGTFGDIRFYTTGILTPGTAVVQAMFAPKAIAYDIRRPLRIRLERDESLRATEVVFTHVYAHGPWRAEMGIKIIADATAP